MIQLWLVDDVLLLGLLLVITTTILVVSVQAWDPYQQPHPCTIPRYTVDQLLSSEPQLFANSGGVVPPLYRNPLVIRRREQDNREFRKLTERDNLVDFFDGGGPDEYFNVTLSSSNAHSEHRRTIPLVQYLDEISSQVETTAETWANETWYLFGETHSDDWQRLLRRYELPPCQTCKSSHVALSFGIGNVGSGVQWHVHGPGFSEALHGNKHWVLLPPSSQPPTGYHKDPSSRQWMEHYYHDYYHHHSNITDSSPLLLECTLEPGDAIYFPDQWWHATINLSPYTAFVSTFTTEHNVERIIAEDDENKDDSNLCWWDLAAAARSSSPCNVAYQKYYKNNKRNMERN